MFGEMGAADALLQSPGMRKFRGEDGAHCADGVLGEVVQGLEGHLLLLGGVKTAQEMDQHLPVRLVSTGTRSCVPGTW